MDCAASGGQVLFDVLLCALAARLKTCRVDVLLLTGCCGVWKARLAAVRRVADRTLVLDDEQGIEYLDVDSLTMEDLNFLQALYGTFRAMFSHLALAFRDPSSSFLGQVSRITPVHRPLT